MINANVQGTESRVTEHGAAVPLSVAGDGHSSAASQ